jgi:hypothetical protein
MSVDGYTKARILTDAADTLRDIARAHVANGLGHMTWAEAVVELRGMARSMVRQEDAEAEAALFSGEDHL